MTTITMRSLLETVDLNEDSNQKNSAYKLSELIKQLQQVQQSQGDIQIAHFERAGYDGGNYGDGTAWYIKELNDDYDIKPHLILGEKPNN